MGLGAEKLTQPGGDKMKHLMRLWKEEEGQDLVEYALLITLISLALVVAMQGLATAISNVFAATVTKLGTT